MTNVQLETQTIPLASIILDKSLWPRLELDEERVKEFKELYEESNVLPPLDVVPVAGNKYKLADGWHRYEALARLKKSAPCVLLPPDTDIYVHACQKSATGSKPMTRAEKRKAALHLLKKHKEWSDNLIAKTCGVSHPFVGRLRKSILQKGLVTLQGNPHKPASQAHEKATAASTALKSAIKFYHEYNTEEERVEALLDEIGEEDEKRVIVALVETSGAFLEVAQVLKEG